MQRVYFTYKLPYINVLIMSKYNIVATLTIYAVLLYSTTHLTFQMSRLLTASAAAFHQIWHLGVFLFVLPQSSDLRRK